MNNPRSLSQNISNQAFLHKFSVDPLSVLSGNTQPIGNLTISTLNLGATGSNCQDAIDELISITPLRVNSIYTSSDGISPAGSPQTDEFKFSGLVSLAGKSKGDTVVFNFYGIKVKILIGDTGEEVAAKVKKTLENYQNSNIIINSVSFGKTLDILTVQYLDFLSHKLTQKYQYGIKVIQTIISESKPGYGTWIKLGTETKKLDGSTDSTTFYYFKRID